jgi:dihydrofolate reductase|tara:strand:+ start:9524 stop:10033 length:510 start_codon:yes stop_codon:yes gene_type:complete
MNIIISHVVALSNNNVIGVDNNLPWNLKTDLNHFKNYTTNKIIVMGRKTFESIGRPLPNRLNFVVSRTIDEIENAFVFKSTKEAIDAAKKKCLDDGNYNEIVIIGGGYLFKDTLEITNKLVLTNVDCDINGDVYYPDIDFKFWKEKSSENFSRNEDNDYNFTVKVYEKI